MNNDPTMSVTFSKHATTGKNTQQQIAAVFPNQSEPQREPSIWMIVAILQSLFWLFGIPVLCRQYLWDGIFGALIASHHTFGIEIAEFFFFVSIPPIILFMYNMAMIPVYAGRYPFFEQYKIQREVCWPWFDTSPKVREDFWKLSLRSIKLTAFNLFLLLPILVAGKIHVDREIFRKDKFFFFDTDDERWPSTGKNIQHVMSLVLLHEFGFYVTHKMMHHYPSLYRYHKVHHEYKINTTLAAQHNHPIDYVICIGGPAVLAVSLVPSAHSISVFQYALWSLWANLDDHVGYAFPWSPVRWFPGSSLTDEHDFHHSKNMGCYASKLSFFNFIFGGYEQYNKHYAGRRGSSIEKESDSKSGKMKNKNDNNWLSCVGFGIFSP